MDLVLEDRSADAAAELVAAIVGLFGFEDTLAVQRLVAEVLERRAAVVVRAGLGNDLHDAARRQSELCLVARVGDLELLDGILRQILPRLAVFRPVVDRAVDDVSGSVERHRSADVDRGEKRPRRVDGRAGDEQRERQILPRVERQRLDLLARDRAGDLGLRDVDYWRLTANRHALGERLHLHRQVLAELEADGDDDVRDFLDAEAGELGA